MTTTTETIPSGGNIFSFTVNSPGGWSSNDAGYSSLTYFSSTISTTLNICIFGTPSSTPSFYQFSGGQMQSFPSGYLYPLNTNVPVTFTICGSTLTIKANGAVIFTLTDAKLASYDSAAVTPVGFPPVTISSIDGGSYNCSTSSSTSTSGIVVNTSKPAGMSSTVTIIIIVAVIVVALLAAGGLYKFVQKKKSSAKDKTTKSQ